MALSDADVQKQVNNMCKIEIYEKQRKRLIRKTIKMSLEASVVSMPKRELKSWDSCRVSCEFYAQLFHSQNMH